MSKVSLWSRRSMPAALTVCLTFGATLPAHADWVGHERRKEVIQRDRNLNHIINRDAGHLNGQYGNLKAQDRSILRQEQRDARADGGNLTHGQTVQLNHEESALHREINMDKKTPGSFASRHPRRAEVLGRDANLNRQIWQDKGHLDGQFGHLEKEDQSIARQEQRDARANGGFITKQEQNQLNREENSLHRQIQRDDNAK